MAVQAAIVMASLTVPVLASLIGPAAGVPAYLVGYYSALVYGFAVATSLLTPTLLRRCGGIRLHQGMLLMTAAAMAALVAAIPVALALSAIVLGCAYGPMNPASTVMLARYTPSRLRARIFSLKQTAVPTGGALAGFAVPIMATRLGWHGTVLAIAAICLGLAVAIEGWRGDLDREALAEARLTASSLSMPVRLLLTRGSLRAVGFCALGFGAVQFSFSTIFPTVLVGIGWQLRHAGMVLSFALVMGMIFRIVWGGIADRVGTRPILALMGMMMAAAALAAAFVGPAWPGEAVFGLSALFGLSAYCWAGIGLAEAVRGVSPALIAAASAGMIGMSFLGALLGPALFSTTIALTGSFRPAFLLLAAASAVPGLLMLRAKN